MRLLIQGAEIEKEMEAKAEVEGKVEAEAVVESEAQAKSEAEAEAEEKEELGVQAKDSIIIKAASHPTAYTQHSVLIIFDCN